MGAPNEPLDYHRHPELKRKLYSALQESEEGELSIVIPQEVALKQSGQSVNPVVSEVATPEPQTLGAQEFEFVVPWYLEEISLEDDEPMDASPTLVFAVGSWLSRLQVALQLAQDQLLFSQVVLTSVQHIVFAAGPFHMYSIPLDHIADDGNSSQPPMYAFCLPGHNSLLTTSTGCLSSAMSFYTTEFGSYPFGSYKLVLVDEMPIQRFNSSAFSLLSVDLLKADGTLYEHVLRSAEGDSEAAEAMGMVDMGFGPEVWEKEGEWNNWKVEDWTEEDETAAMSGAMYEWIRMDTDFEWIARFHDLFAHTYVPKPNNFSDLPEYFVRKSPINTISWTRYTNGKSPSSVREFLIDWLRYNDNTSNDYA
ncbi:hypothetical protein K438DRAFT_1986684 [Mycena galopus ATCC 62051]|nr:hypothetical protein K438DRAFT_1986684 [Mycena galopus ATCC 62051]